MTRRWAAAIVVVMTLSMNGVVVADSAPIAGTVKAIDPTARNLTVEASVRGRTRVVVIDVKPPSKIVRFVRSADTAKPGFTEQAAALEDIKTGWSG